MFLPQLKRVLGNSKGFTLLELLVVISIIAILAGVILVNLQSARKKARDATIRSDINTVMKALETHIAVNNDENLFTTNCTTIPLADAGNPLATLVGPGKELPKMPAHPAAGKNYTFASTLDAASGILSYVVSGELGAGVESGKFFVAANGSTSLETVAPKPVGC